MIMNKMVQKVKTLVTKPDDPGLILGNHMIEAENQLLPVFL